jgi:hypothetical protein
VRVKTAGKPFSIATSVTIECSGARADKHGSSLERGFAEPPETRYRCLLAARQVSHGHRPTGALAYARNAGSLPTATDQTVTSSTKSL